MWDRTMRLGSLAFVWLSIGTVALGQDPDLRNDPDREYLRDAKLPTDGAGLLDYLAQLSGDDADLQRLDELIRQLGGSNFPKRAEASRRLVGLGEAGLAKLQLAQKDADIEVAKRATKCIRDISEKHRWGVPFVVVRFLGKLRPDGLAETLLRYLPYSGDPDVEEELWFGFYALVKDRPQLLGLVEKHLNDPIPARRALSACVLARLGTKQQQASVRKLLADPDPTVRLRAAQGLLAGKDAAGIPTLIELLSQPAVDISWSAEELLHWVAGDNAPAQKIGAASEPERRASQKAWEGWWRIHEAKFSFVELDKDHRRPGVFVSIGHSGTQDRRAIIRVYGCDGDPRWQCITDVLVKDAKLLSGNRFLTYALQTEKPALVEYDLRGNALWRPEFSVTVASVNPKALAKTTFTKTTFGPGVLSCQRLPNGNTLVALGLMGVLEITQSGKQVAWADRFPDNLFCDQFLNNGRVLCVQKAKHKAVFAEFDPYIALQKRRIELRADFPLYVLQVQELSNGNFLCSDVREADASVFEVDSSGKRVWQLLRPSCQWALRLRTGHTVIAAGNVIQEVASDGRVLWEAVDSFHSLVTRVRVWLPLVRLGFDRPRAANWDLTKSVPYRLAELKHKDPDRRRYAVRALGSLGSQAVPPIPFLIDLLEQPGFESVVAEAIEQIGAEAYSPIIEATKDTRPLVRGSAVYMLSLFPNKGHHVPTWLAAINDNDLTVRYNALRSIGTYLHRVKNVGLSAQDETRLIERITAVIAHMASRGSNRRPAELAVLQTATVTLAAFGPKAKSAIPVLIGYLKGSDQELHRLAAIVLGRIGAEASSAVPQLLRSFPSKSDVSPIANDTRQAMLVAFGRLGTHAKQAIPLLLDVLRGKDYPSSLRVSACDSLEKIGHLDSYIDNALSEAAKGEDTLLSQASRRTLEYLRAQR